MSHSAIQQMSSSWYQGVMRAALQRSHARSALTRARSGRHRVARLLPRLHATGQRLGVAERRALEPYRLTGGRRLVGSATVEDERLVARHAVDAPL